MIREARERKAWLLLGGSLAVGFVLRAYLAVTDDGMVWPDEIYQSLEPAHALVFGYGLLPWEYLQGLRTVAVPGLVAMLLKLCTLTTLDSPRGYVVFVKLIFAGISAATALGVERLARRAGAQPWDASIAALAYGLSTFSLYFGNRALSENLAAALLVWGVALLAYCEGARRERVLGGSLLGLATLLRLSSAIVVLGIVIWLGIRAWSGPRERRLAWRELVLTLTCWALVYGALDAVSWHGLPTARFGGWFHSALAYIQFNLGSGGGNTWGTAAWSYYAVHFAQAMPELAGVLVLALAWGLSRAPGLALLVLGFVLVHMLIAHKELRFLLPVFPLACALLALGLSALPARLVRGGRGLVCALVVIGLLRLSELRMGDLGNPVADADTSAWDFSGSVNRLLFAANRQPELCGLRIRGVHLAFTGGSSYLHRPVPIYGADGTSAQGHFNYAIARAGKVTSGQVVARDGTFELVRVADGCRPDPDFVWRLPR